MLYLQPSLGMRMCGNVVWDLFVYLVSCPLAGQYFLNHYCTLAQNLAPKWCSSIQVTCSLCDFCGYEILSELVVRLGPQVYPGLVAMAGNIPYPLSEILQAFT